MVEYVKIIKEVGFPIFTSLFLLVLLVWLLNFIFKTLFNLANLGEKNTSTLAAIQEVTQKIWEKLLKNSRG